MKLKSLLLCVVIVLVLTMTGCTSTKPAPQSGVSETITGVNAVNEPAADVVADNETADNAIVLNGETLIYEDDYCSISAWFTETGIITSMNPKSDLLVGIYLTDVFINGHPVDMSKYIGSYITSEIKFKINEAFGFKVLDPKGGGIITPMSALKSYIEGWEKGDQAEHMSFTLHVININDYPDGTPNVAVPFTLCKP